jgi:hypothetical protein
MIVVKRAGAPDNEGMNLFLALIWTLCAIVLLAYEHYVGVGRFRIRMGDTSFSAAWLMFALALYNLVRWWGNRSYRAEQRAREIAQASREWEMRRRHSEPAGPPDPNFNFTNEPPPAPNPNITHRPPSNP